MSFKLLSYNVRYGGGGREPHLAAVIREADPDLVVLQEATDPRVVEDGHRSPPNRARDSASNSASEPVISRSFSRSKRRNSRRAKAR